MRKRENYKKFGSHFELKACFGFGMTTNKAFSLLLISLISLIFFQRRGINWARDNRKLTYRPILIPTEPYVLGPSAGYSESN
jgi:hypothetical protein